METVLITGGAGFIGSHLCEVFLKQGYSVAVVDSLVSGKVENVPKACKFFYADITDRDALKLIFNVVRPTIISHHAAQTKIDTADKSPSLDAEVNIMGLLNVLSLAAHYKVKQVVFASSAAVYGSSKKLPSIENTRLTPDSAYGIAKMTGENYVQFYAKKFGFIFTIFRYANVYGPRQVINEEGEGSVTAVLISKLMSNKRPTIHGDGLQSRNFVYVKDVAEANYIAIRDQIGGIYNLSTRRSTSILQLYKLVSKLLSKSIEPQFKKNNNFGVKVSRLSEILFNYKFKITHKTPLADGLKQTINYMKNSKNDSLLRY